MSEVSTKPFGDALRELMDARSLTYRALAEATREIDGRGITHAHINMLANGHDRPSMRAMELVAEACGVGPTYFAEYRLAVHGERVAVSAPVEQRTSKSHLKTRDAACHGGMVDSQSACRGGECSVARKRDEVAKIFPVDRSCAFSIRHG